MAMKVRKHATLVLGCIAMYILIMCWACHARFSAYAYGDFDLAHHAQSTWNIIHGSLDCSILGIPFLGNHMTIILFLIAPLYAVFTSPLLLLYLQTLALGMGAWGIFLLARREIPIGWATGLSLVYLVCPPLLYLNLHEFHPIALAVPFLIGMLYFYKTDRFRLFLTFLLLALSCQENVALIAVAFAFYALLDGRKGPWFSVPLALGIIYFTLVVLIIMPRLNNNTIQFIRIYGHLGNSLPEVFKNIILHPIYTLRYMFTAEKLAFLNALFGPVAYMGLLSPLNLLPASLVAIQRLLSIRASETSIVYHYQAEFIPFIFFAAIYGVKNILTLKRRIAKPCLRVALVLFPLAAILAAGILPALGRAFSAPWSNSFIRSKKNSIIRNLPDDASILATFEFLPKLANRRKVYSLHHVYTGRHTLSDAAYPQPDADHIIMDTNDPLTFSARGFYGPENYRRLQAVLDNPGWKLIEHVDSLLVFRNASGINVQPLDLVEYINQPPEMNRNIDQAPDADIQLLGFNIGLPDKDNIVSLTLYWKKTHESGKDYDMYLTVTGKSILYRGHLSPGSRIWPPQTWEAGKLIADRHRVRFKTGEMFPDDIKVGVELFLLEEQ